MNRALRLPSAWMLAIFVLSLGLIPSVALAQWPNPAGIPKPSFGVDQTAPSIPDPWNSETPGFYYVEASSDAATDDGNTYGSRLRPRRTIPNYLPAGSVVELRGTYSRAHSSPRTIVAAGTAESPVFIRGASRNDRPRITAGWEIKGSYLILENLTFGPAGTSTGSVVMLSPSHHLALRYSELTGNLTGGGLGIESWDGSRIDNVVIFKNNVHDNGDVNATYDQDVHGIHVGQRASSIWIVGNELSRNSGDGLQINAGSLSNQSGTHHIYVGSNVAYRNKQTGFWSKQATDVIFSQNECFGHRPGNSSYGPCMGYQYATDWVWFIFNKVHDSDFGIAVSDDSGLGSGTEAYFIGNVIYNIHRSNGPYLSQSAWGNAAIMLAGGVKRYVVGNTIYDVDAGINSPSPFGTLEIADNIVANVSWGSHIYVEHASLSSKTSAHHNLFDVHPRIRTAGGTVVANDEQLGAMLSLAGDPKFIDAAGENFRVKSTSPAKDAGEVHAALTTFANRYGVSINVDASGRPRTGRAVDIGAYVAGSIFEDGDPPGEPPDSAPPDDPKECSLGAPRAPTGLTFMAQANGNLTLTWSRPSGCVEIFDYIIGTGVTPGGAPLAMMMLPKERTEYSTTGLPPGAVYAWVAARNRAGTSPRSNEVLVSGMPGAPTNLSVLVSGKRVLLSWSPPGTSGTPSYYILEAGWSPGSSDAARMVTKGPDLSHEGAASSGTFYVRVRAVNSAGIGPPSNEVVVTVE